MFGGTGISQDALRFFNHPHWIVPGSKKRDFWNVYCLEKPGEESSGILHHALGQKYPKTVLKGRLSLTGAVSQARVPGNASLVLGSLVHAAGGTGGFRS